MATFLTTLIFNATKNGWSENWYWTGADHASAQAAALVLASARQKLLAQGVILEAVRTSDVAILGDSVIALAPAIPAAGKPALARDNASNAWLSRINAGALYRRQLWLRGIPDDWIEFNADGTPKPPPAALGKVFDAYVLALTKGPFQLKVIDKGPGSPLTSILVVAADVPTGLTKVTANGHGLANFDFVRIKGAKGVNASLLNGVWQIQDVTANTFVIGLPAADLATINYVTLSGKVQKRATTYVNVTSGVILRGGTRKTGRAFFVSPGRRRARR